jgi:hypothetical protein
MLFPQEVPNLVQHHVRGRNVFVGFGQLLGQQLLDALVLSHEESLEFRHPLGGCRRRRGGFP